MDSAQAARCCQSASANQWRHGDSIISDPEADFVIEDYTCVYLGMEARNLRKLATFYHAMAWFGCFPNYHWNIFSKCTYNKYFNVSF